jgi:hypothetical protein
MTVEEKVAQLTSLSEYRLELRKDIIVIDDSGNLSFEFKALLRNGIGEFTRPAGNLLRLDRPQKRKNPAGVAKFTNRLQKYVIENTRLGGSYGGVFGNLWDFL